MYLEAYYTQNGQRADLINEIDDSAIYAFSKGLVFRKYLKKDWMSINPIVVNDVSNTHEVEYVNRMKISNSFVFEFHIYSFEQKNYYLLQMCNNIRLIDFDGSVLSVLDNNGMKEPIFEETDSRNILLCKLEFIFDNNLAVIAGSLS